MATRTNQYSLIPLNPDLRLLRTPEPPYYVVISTNIHHGKEIERYDKLFASTLEEANKIEGYLGMDSAKETLESGEIYSISAIYFASLDALEKWRQHAKHTTVKKNAKQRWFAEHNIRVCQVLEHYGSNLTHR